MALLKPPVEAVFQQEGYEPGHNPTMEILQRAKIATSAAEEKRLSASELLSRKGLSREQAAGQLIETAQYASDEALRFRALEKVLSIHSIIQDNETAAPVVNINIVGGGEIASLNSILTPRQTNRE
jgi:hypothetical protein